MKRVLLGFSIFLVAFFAGYVIVPEFGTMLTDQSPPQAVERVTQLNANSAPIVSSPKDEDFVPEFRDLPTYEDLEREYNGTEDSRVKLIDVSEFVYPDESWPRYRKSEILAKSGETWLGLYQINGVARLTATKVKTELVPRERAPGGEPYYRLKYYRLKYDNPGTPVFLIKGSENLKPGWIDSIYRRPELSEEYLAIGYRQEFHLNSIKYTLRVAPGNRRDGSRASVLVLETDNLRQIVEYNSFYEKGDNIGSLLWAGDLDGDGKLDLYFDDYNFEKGGFGSNLYLSSEAQPGELLRYVAGFSTGGC